MHLPGERLALVRSQPVALMIWPMTSSKVCISSLNRITFAGVAQYIGFIQGPEGDVLIGCAGIHDWLNPFKIQVKLAIIRVLCKAGV